MYDIWRPLAEVNTQIAQCQRSSAVVVKIALYNNKNLKTKTKSTAIESIAPCPLHRSGIHQKLRMQRQGLPVMNVLKINGCVQPPQMAGVQTQKLPGRLFWTCHKNKNPVPTRFCRHQPSNNKNTPFQESSTAAHLRQLAKKKQTNIPNRQPTQSLRITLSLSITHITEQFRNTRVLRTLSMFAAEELEGACFGALEWQSASSSLC